MTLSSFLHMGGYAAFVWPAYAVFFVLLAADWILPVARRHRLLRELGRRLARQRAQRRQRIGQPPTTPS